MKLEISFEALPLWRGVQKKPGVRKTLPFHLGWDPRGYICQTMSASVRQEIINAYSAEDYAYITNPPGSSKWANRLGDRNIEFVKRVCDSLDRKNVLEIGAGSVYIAERLTQEYKIPLYMIMDPSITESSTKENIHVVREYFQRDQHLDDSFECILNFGVVEHVPDPAGFLMDLNAILLPTQGRAILVFPNTERSLRVGDLTVLIHEHLSYFTENTATNLIRQCGFDILAYETKEDSFSFYLKAIREPEAHEAIPMDEILQVSAASFYQNIDSASTQLHAALEKGETIALHGACNGLNNLLYVTGLRDVKNFWIFDGDDTKVGNYLPACPVEIRHSEDPDYGKVDKVFVAATTFYYEIQTFLKEKHKILASDIIPLDLRTNE